MATWDEMEPRERDAWVAENVMGYVWFRFRRGDGSTHEILMQEFGKRQCEALKMHTTVESGPCDDSDTSGAPQYTTDASADYLVLKRVRDTWDEKMLWNFGQRFHGITGIRAVTDSQQGVFAVMYEPGDYSHAAYLALTS